MFSFLTNINLAAIAVVVMLIVFAVNAFFIVYHLTRFGIGTAPKLIALVFVVGCMFMVLMIIALYVGLTFPSFNFLNP